MAGYQVYQDIQARTGNEIYIGVVGPVRTGKSTFIRRFMELVALPQLDEKVQAELRDQLPISGSGKTITTAEPKFIPREAVSVRFDENQAAKIKLIDCVGFLVKDAAGHIEEGKERMVKTPWSREAIPFPEAARLGTQKVIREHSTIGIVMTTDGSFGELPRENFVDAEKATVEELKKQDKPFMIVLNTKQPYKEETRLLAGKLEEQYHVAVLPVNCEQLKMEDVNKILEKILYEFPISEIRYFIPKWVEMLPSDHEVKAQILCGIRDRMGSFRHIRDITSSSVELQGPYVQDTMLESIGLSDGIVKIHVQVNEEYYYQLLSQLSGISMESEYDLIQTMKELADMKKQYVKVQSALESVRGSGYGMVVPELSEIAVDTPQIIHQGNKYGVKIKSRSPSIHMIRANIETEIAPIVGTEQQAQDLIHYIEECGSRGESIWETNIFGKSIEQLVQDGIRNKLAAISEESQSKLQDTMQKIVNDSKGGLVCIII